MIAAVAAVALVAGASLSVAFDPAEPLVGEPVEVTLTVRGAPGEPRFPVWRETWGDAEVLEVAPPTASGGVWRQTVRVAIFAPGEHTLPVPSVTLPGAADRPLAPGGPLRIGVRSVLPEDPQGVEPRPSVPPARLPLGGPFLWSAATLGLACLGLALLTAGRRRTRPAEAPSAPPLDPLAELERALATIGPDDGDRAWQAASAALRRYLGRRLGFPALESTTTEVRRRLHAIAAPSSVTAGAARLLRRADEVKFARRRASREELREALDTARRVAADVEAHLAPPPSEEAA